MKYLRVDGGDSDEIFEWIGVIQMKNLTVGGCDSDEILEGGWE